MKTQCSFRGDMTDKTTERDRLTAIVNTRANDIQEYFNRRKNIERYNFSLYHEKMKIFIYEAAARGMTYQTFLVSNYTDLMVLNEYGLLGEFVEYLENEPNNLNAQIHTLSESAGFSCNMLQLRIRWDTDKSDDDTGDDDDGN
jgi:hypothetical protein